MCTGGLWGGIVFGIDTRRAAVYDQKKQRFVRHCGREDGWGVILVQLGFICAKSIYNSVTKWFSVYVLLLAVMCSFTDVE